MTSTRCRYAGWNGEIMIRPRFFCLVALLSATVPCARGWGPPAGLETTVNLYLTADAGYRQGDLLTRSQLEEMQLYLSRTQGDSTATRTKWRYQALPDNAPLVKIFYSGGASVLREIAAQRGSYAELELLSRSAQGRQQLQRSIDRKSPAELIQFLAAQQAELAAKQSSAAMKLPATTRPKRIYTAAGFLAALAAPLPAEPAPVGPEPRVPEPVKLEPVQSDPVQSDPVEPDPVESEIEQRTTATDR